MQINTSTRPTELPRLGRLPEEQRFPQIYFIFLALLLLIKMLLAATLASGAGYIVSKLVDLIFLSMVFLGVVFHSDYYLQRCAALMILMLAMFAQILLTGLISEQPLGYAIFELLKFLTPLFFFLVIYRLYEYHPTLVLRLIKIMVYAVYAMALVGLTILPNEWNRAQMYLPAYFAGLHTSSYTLLMAATAVFFLSLAGQINRYVGIFMVMVALWLVFFGWGVRTAMIGVVVFSAVWYLQSGWKHKVIASAVAVGAVTLLFFIYLLGVLKLPTWNDLITLSSGRVAMWAYKFQIYAQGTVAQIFLGQGGGSDYVYSNVWWWGAKDSHNDFIKALTERGLIGSALLVAVLIAWIRSVGKRGPMIAVFAMYVASSLFSNGIMGRPHAGFMFALALIAALHYTLHSRVSADKARPANQ